MIRMKTLLRVYPFLVLSLWSCQTASKLHVEKTGMLLVEAEDFDRQELDEKRKWYRTTADDAPSVGPDHDANHAATASNKSYLEILPDTRKNHDEKLIHGENFSNEPGKLAILHYDVIFENTGRFYVWVRAFSTGSEDNGIHVGIDGVWPESGQRMQWCDGKNEWTWESKQRTKEEHCGVERLIYLDIESAGQHTISFSMREDGFEFDAWAMSKEYVRPE